MILDSGLLFWATLYVIFNVLPNLRHRLLCLKLRYRQNHDNRVIKNNRGGSRSLREGVRSLPFPSSPVLLFLSVLPLFPFLLEIRLLKPARGYVGALYKFPQWGLGRSPSRKRIWCTLKLSDSHWSQ